MIHLESKKTDPLDPDNVNRSIEYKKTVLAALGVLLLASAVHAQDSLRLTLSEAVKQGVNNNKSIRAEALNLDIDADQLGQVNSVFLPSVTGNAGVLHYINIPVQYTHANALDPTAPADKYVGLRLLLPNSFGSGISVNWALYDQALFSSLKIIKEHSNTTVVQLQKDKSEIAYAISQVYYGIAFAIKQKENLVTIAANMDKLLVFLQANYNNGTILRSELDKVRVNKTNILSQIDALSSAIDTQVNLLKLFTGLPTTVKLRLTEINFEGSLRAVTDTSAPIETTFDYRLMQSEIRMNRLERLQTMANYFPKLGLAYNYSYNIVSPGLSGIFTSKFNFPVQYIGINLTVPIFDGRFNHFKLKENAIKRKQLDLQSDFLSDKIRTDITNARLSYNSSLNNMVSNAANMKLAQELYDQSLEQYHQGTIPLTDVLTYETSLEQATVQYFNSVSGALTSLLAYKKSTNTLLDQ